MTNRAICQELANKLKEKTKACQLRLLSILFWLSISRGIYYRAIGYVENSNLRTAERIFSKRSVSKRIEELVIQTALEHPMLGYKKIHHILITRKNVTINKKTVHRILKESGLLKKQKKRLKEIKNRYKRKLKELKPTKINQVWQMDVTYVYVEGDGFYFLIDVQDYYSKYILAQRLCYSYNAKEAIETLRYAIQEEDTFVWFIKRAYLSNH